MATESSSTPDNTLIFQQLDSYPWNRDAEFQGGLSAILGTTTSPSQIQELTLRAKVFYLSRKKSIPVDFDAYKAYLSSTPPPTSQISAETPPAKPAHETLPQISSLNSAAQSSTQEAPATAPANENPETNESSNSKSAQAPYPQTFAEIVSLITAGAPIPGIKDVPPTLLTDQATKPTASKRRKPWEKDVPAESVQGKGSLLGDGAGTVQGTFGDRRDEVIVQDLPSD